MIVSKDFTFDAAHFLTDYHGKCERLHGHTYKLRVNITGQLQENGMILDFIVLKNIVKRQVLDRLDHYNLNEVMENPTCERIAMWIWDELVDLPNLLQSELDNPNFPEEIKKLLRDPEGARKDINTRVRLHSVQLWETATSSVTYSGE